MPYHGGVVYPPPATEIESRQVVLLTNCTAKYIYNNEK
jgi:hypothetical protein